MWRDGHLTGEENALEASFGIPNKHPPNLPPANIITNFIFGTLVRATPCFCIPGNAAERIAPYNSLFPKWSTPIRVRRKSNAIQT